jgi:hypothetical protein
LKLYTTDITFILAVLSTHLFNAQFYKLNYTYSLATPKSFDAQKFSLRESTI